MSTRPVAWTTLENARGRSAGTTTPVSNDRTFTLGERIGIGASRLGDRIRANENVIDDAVPYLSNVATLFRRAPMPATPVAEQYVSTQPIRLTQARAEVDRAARAADKAVAQGLSGQEAAAVRAAQLGERFNQYSRIAAEESAQNAAQRQQTIAANIGIGARNTERQNQYNQDIVARNIAQARVGSENLANFSDKAVQIAARREAAALDREKFNVLSRMYTPGLMNRVAEGLETPGSKEKIKKAYGGKLSRIKRVF